MPELKLTNLAKKHKRNTTWSPEARIQAVSQYLVLGNMALVSATTGIPHQLLRAWKGQPWWKDVENEVRATENLEMDNKLSKIVDRSLDAVLDRVENGEFVYNQKTGQIIRKPVNLKDAAKVSVDLITKRELLRGNATERKETTQISVAEQLKQLAVEFARWQPGNVIKQETIDVEVVERLEDDEVVPDNWVPDQVLDDFGSDGSGEMAEEDEAGDSSESQGLPRSDHEQQGS